MEAGWAGWNDNYKADMERLCAADFIPWEELRGKTILITGATGLIGYTLTNALLYADQRRGLALRVAALVRDEGRARERFAAWQGGPGHLQFLSGSVEELPGVDFAVHYIIHGASRTASREFIAQPVETMQTALLGTRNMLELAKEKQVSGFVYLSSMEVYGRPERGHRVTEDEAGALAPLEPRNSYPISKQACEALCCAYASEYHVPAAIARLAQTFGPGVQEKDVRIFAEFGRCILEKRDIVLKTKGGTERSYLYTADAAAAVLAVLLKGKPGQAYNAADENTYCSIAEMAHKVAKWGGIQVKFDLQDERKLGYPETLYMDLDTTLLKGLGWRPEALGGGIGSHDWDVQQNDGRLM